MNVCTVILMLFSVSRFVRSYPLFSRSFLVPLSRRISSKSMPIHRAVKISLSGADSSNKTQIFDHLRYLGFPVFQCLTKTSEGSNSINFKTFTDLIEESETLQDIDYIRDKINGIDIPNSLKENMLVEIEGYIKDLSKHSKFAIFIDDPSFSKFNHSTGVHFTVPGSSSLEDTIEIGPFFEKSEMKSKLATAIETIITAHPLEWRLWKSRKLQNIEILDHRLHGPHVSDEGLIKESIDLIIFDLDDTLLDTRKPIDAANVALLKLMKNSMPRTFQDMPKYKDTLMRKHKENPALAHDITTLRTLALLQLSKQYGEQDAVSEAMKVFVETRSRVGEYLYEDVLPCINWLQTLKIPFAVLTNGNADLSLCPTLSSKLYVSMNAIDVGTKKPSTVPFLAMSQYANVLPSRIVVIGDSYECDVQGAINNGMIGCHLKRIKPTDKISQPDDAFSSIKNLFPESGYFELNTLQPEEITRKLANYLKTV